MNKEDFDHTLKDWHFVFYGGVLLGKLRVQESTVTHSDGIVITVRRTTLSPVLDFNAFAEPQMNPNGRPNGRVRAIHNVFPCGLLESLANAELEIPEAVPRQPCSVLDDKDREDLVKCIELALSQMTAMRAWKAGIAPATGLQGLPPPPARRD